MKPLFDIKRSRGGLDDAVKRWESLKPAEIEAAVLDAGEAVAWNLIAEIEYQANLGPNERWQHVAGYFEPVRTDANVGVWVNPEYPEGREAFDLEYGTMGRAPLPVLRSSISASEREGGRVFSEELNRGLFGA